MRSSVLMSLCRLFQRPSGAHYIPATLPFTDKDRFWIVEPTHNWLEDCEVGESYGRIYLSYLRANSTFPPLGWILRDMIAAGQYSGVEHGFASVIWQSAADGSAKVTPIDLQLGRYHDSGYASPDRGIIKSDD